MEKAITGQKRKERELPAGNACEKCKQPGDI